MPQPHLARVLVTGATGTLGYNLVRHLGLTHPRTQVHVLMRTLDASLFADLPNVTLQQNDLAVLSSLAPIVRTVQPTAILHCAASGVRPSRIGWFDQIQLNVSATVALFEASCEIPDCHFIHVSTGLAYGEQSRACHEHDPIDTLHPYGASKAAADCLLRAGAERLHRHLTVVRPFSFTGLHDGGDRLFPSLLRAAQEGRPFRMSAGTQIRDFCAVQDVVEGITLLLEAGNVPGRDTFNLGSGLELPLLEIVQSVIAQLGLRVQLEPGVLPLHPQEPHHLVADITRAAQAGWRPRTNLAYAVWQLAQSQYPTLNVNKPEHDLAD